MTDLDPRTVYRNSNSFRRLPLRRRFELSYVVADSGCWEWLGSKTVRGYGQFKYGPRPQRAHRVSYILHIGPIPEGMTIDHRCANKGCVNPEHLEPVTGAENHRRWAASLTHCQRGHEFTAENTYTAPSGHRTCRICRLARRRAGRER